MSASPTTERRLGDMELRRQINRSVSRALVDRDYARHLLINPALALEGRAISDEQLRSLLSIHASDLTDFARQAQVVFRF